MSDEVKKRTQKGKSKKIKNPFPGLRPFAIEESHLFFGREGQTDEVLDKLSRHKFVGIIGPSGSGKSSFVYCGVLPILYGGFLTATGPNWEVIVTRPGNAPVDNLAQAILGKDIHYLVADPEEKRIKEKITATLLNSSSLGLVEAIEQVKRATDKNYLILVDQFEELFRFKRESEKGDSINETLAFVNMLMEAVNHEGSPIYVAITMRSDFIGECAQFPVLTRKINDSHYLIPQLTRDQKRSAIEGPVAVGGGQVTVRLVQQLLNDLGDNPDQLPILQHALMRTWDYWSNNREGEEPMDLKHYEAIGTMKEALSMHANEAYDELNDKQKEICQALFKAITEKRGETFGIRRPTQLKEIAAIAEVKWEEVAEVIEKFRQPGRSLLTPPIGVQLRPEHMIDISHESLMRIWVRLKNWVDEEAEAVQMYLRLAEAAEMYQIGKSALWRPPDLHLALNWKAKHKPTLVWGQRYHPAYERTMVFLQYSEKEWEEEQRIKELQAKRQLRAARITAVILGTAVVVSMGFLLYAFVQQGKAIAAAEEALLEAQNARINSFNARVQEGIATVNRWEADEQTEIALLERDKADSLLGVALVATDSATMASIRAERERDNAIHQERLALMARDEADSSAEVARYQEQLATQSAEEANIARHLAVAKQLALKAQSRQADLTLNGLLAQQAYNFNKEFDGQEFDADIYAGLYFGIKFQGEETMNYHPLVEPLPGHSKEVNSIVSSSSSEFVYSGGSQGKILAWSQTDERWRSRDMYHQPGQQIQSLAETDDGRWLVAATFEPSTLSSFLLVFDLTRATQTPSRISGFNGATKFKLAFAPNSNTLYILDNKGKSIKRVTIPSGEVSNIINSEEEINRIAISPDGSRIAGVTKQGRLMIWDRENQYSGEEYVPKVNNALWSVAWSNDGSLLVTGDEQGWVRVYSANNGVIRNIFASQDNRITEIEFSPNGRYFAAASKNKTVKLWDLSRINDPPIRMTDHANWVLSIAFTPDSEQIFAGSVESNIKVWPTSINLMSNIICGLIDRNMSREEWVNNVQEGVEYEKTCPALPIPTETVSLNK